MWASSSSSSPCVKKKKKPNSKNPCLGFWFKNGGGWVGLIDSDHTFPKVLNNKEEVGKVANSSFLLLRSGVRAG